MASFGADNINCQSVFKLGRKIGSGGFGSVYEGTWNGQEYAIKIVNSKHYFVPESDTKTGEPILTDHSLQAIYESLITAYLKSRGCTVVRTHKSFKCANDQVFVIMDKLLGIDLQELINNRRIDYDIKEYFILTYRLLCGLVCCHRNGIIHGDIKPENIFIEKDLDGFKPVYIDFGLSCFDRKNFSEGFRSFVKENINPKLLDNFRKTRGCNLRFGGGTIYYTAPEFLGLKGPDTSNYTLEYSELDRLILQDSYSLGMTLYVMWVGGDPYDYINDVKVYKNIIQKAVLDGGPSMSLDYFHFDVPEEIIDIIVGLIETDYRKRTTVEQALSILEKGFLMDIYELPKESCGS